MATRSTCPYCSVSCGVIIHTIGDKAKSVTPHRWFTSKAIPDTPSIAAHSFLDRNCPGRRAYFGLTFLAATLWMHSIWRGSMAMSPGDRNCDTCQMYTKSVNLTKDGFAVPEVDEIATVALDVWADENGYSKIEQNLLGM
jgi:hypothetical protein